MARYRDAVFALIAFALLLAPSPSLTAEPDLLNSETFQVAVTDEDGKEKESFRPGETVYFDIRFVLALSEIDRYPVTITLISQAGGKTVETQLYQGQLNKGLYRLQTPYKPSERGDVTAKLIFKTRVFNRQKSGSTDSFYSYQRWEGNFRIGY